MRRLVWVFLVGCGSVTNNQVADAPPGDGGGAAPGTVRWVRSLSSMSALGIADGAGGLVVTGALYTPGDLGSGMTLTPTGGADLVYAGFNSEDASTLYAARYGDTGQAYGFMHNVDANGAPILYGVSYGSVDLGAGKVAGGTPGTGTLPADGYIGRYTTMKASWVARIVGTGEDKILATAPAGGNSIYGAGWFENTPTFNGATLTSAGGRDLFLARFNTFTGAVDLTKTYGGPGREEISSAAAAGNELILAGFFGDTGVAPDVLDFHGTAKPLGSNGGLDIWVAKLDASGNGIWAVHYGGAGDDRDPRIAVDAAGDIYITGSFTGQVAFGAVNLVAIADVDIFVAKLRGSDGSVAWAISRGGAMNDRAGDIAVDSAGHVVFGGTIDGTPAAAGDALLESVDASNGASRWVKKFASSGSDTATAMTYGRNGDVYAVVNLGGPFDFGVPVIGPAGPASVILRIAP
jgi:hypothetical protein